MWDVLFYDDGTRRAYRLQAKRLTVGDGVALDSLQDELAGREDLKGRTLLSLANNYPLMRYGTARVESALLEEPPALDEQGDPVLLDGADWQPVELTEALFWSLDETLFYLWLDAVVRKNPHRDPTLDLLKKNVMQAWQARLNNSATSDSENADDV